jgi:hypothetical protein
MTAIWWGEAGRFGSWLFSNSGRALERGVKAAAASGGELPQYASRLEDRHLVRADGKTHNFGIEEQSLTPMLTLQGMVRPFRT